MFHRIFKIPKSRSFFLFGARATGKAELLKREFSNTEAVMIDLLDPELAGRLSAYPNELLQLILPHQGNRDWVIIDEVQKVPQLLEIVHSQISAKNFKFALTGSSARKLKRGAANLLAGRAFVFNLFPLTHRELGGDFDLNTALAYGGLPDVYNLEADIDRRRFLKAYAQTYLKEEVIAEQIVRNLPPFRRFLDIVGVHTSEIINYSNIAKDIDSDPKTVSRYFEILEDTLLGFHLPSYERSIRKQQKKSKRFYFFDTGVARVLAGRVDQPIQPKTFEYGQLFENFIVNEIYRLLTYAERQFKLSFLRVSETQEIDLIVEKGADEIYLCEIKSTDRVDDRYIQSLKTLAKDFTNPKLRLISNDPTTKQIGDVLALPWKEALKEICA
ncbi:AAA family ATPase [Oligoflexia bacterium]|nr:AAA family ATPase [Oligoflexia bacterium]